MYCRVFETNGDEAAADADADADEGEEEDLFHLGIFGTPSSWFPFFVDAVAGCWIYLCLSSRSLMNNPKTLRIRKIGRVSFLRLSSLVHLLLVIIRTQLSFRVTIN